LERVPSEGHGQQALFIPVRFIFTNKLTRAEKLLMAFDAIVLSESLGREVNLGKIVHGEAHTTLHVKTSDLAKESRKLTEKIAMLLSSSSPPDLILNKHCAECEFQTQCRQKATEKDDLSLLSGMTERERRRFHNKGIFTVTQLSYTFKSGSLCQKNEYTENFRMTLSAAAIHKVRRRRMFPVPCASETYCSTIVRSSECPRPLCSLPAPGSP
jgi:predicted RecB family nuclease